MMAATTYAERRGRLQTYFDATAVEAWKQLTSDAPVSKIRQTVREGRDQMRATLMSWLPTDLRQTRLLDAGCGTGALSVAAARRGAHVVAIDIAANLIEVARDRAPADPAPGAIEFRVGDLLDPNLGAFAHVVAMDSLIHYPAREIVRVISGLTQQTQGSVLFTFAPQTPALTLMRAMGRLFPRADRAPDIEPVTEAVLRKGFAADPAMSAWRVARTTRVQRGFYTSQAMELVRR